MESDAPYRKQVALLMRVLPVVAQEQCFALKGGTAINLFVRDMPRLSVDIDLAYLPVRGREESLREIGAAMKNIRGKVAKGVPGSKIQASMLSGTDFVVKLVVSTFEAQIKIEVTPVLRGTVFPSELRRVSEKVEDQFGYAETAVVSFADLYGGKIVAALDRQHPRDLYDTRLLVANEGIGREVFQGFLVYLISHDRPMSELISPKRRDIRQEFERGFAGMTLEPVTVEDLEEAREDLARRIQAAFMDSDKELLLSVKRGEPRWELLGIAGVSELPAVRWKLQNLEKLETAKRQDLLAKLEKALGVS